MGKRKYKSYSNEFKAKVAQAAMKEDKRLNELSQIYQVPAAQISQWKSQFKERMHEVFDNKNKKSQKEKEQEELINQLYQQLGKLQYEQEWLKKKLDL